MTVMDIGALRLPTEGSRLAPFDEQMVYTVALCRSTLDRQFSGFAERLGWPHRSPQDWFAIVRQLPYNRRGLATLRRLKAEAAARGVDAPAGAIEQYALLNAILAAAPRVTELPVDISVMRQFCWTFAQIANPAPVFHKYFDCDRWGYHEVAQIVTLDRFPAGQHNWVVTKAARTGLLRLNPFDAPRLVGELIQGYGGFASVAGLHLNVWRSNPHLVLRAEAGRSLYRLAKSLELQPNLRGLQALSWLHAKDVAKVSPHLAWMRDFFVENGAFTAELEPATAETGLVMGSVRRGELFDNGYFRPSMTLLLWRRADILKWASRHPELRDDTHHADIVGHGRPMDYKQLSVSRPTTGSQSRRPGLPSDSRPTGRRWFSALPRQRPALYALCTLLIPALGVAAAHGLMVAWWIAVPAFAVAIVLLWLCHLFIFRWITAAPPKLAADQ